MLLLRSAVVKKGIRMWTPLLSRDLLRRIVRNSKFQISPEYV